MFDEELEDLSRFGGDADFVPAEPELSRVELKSVIGEADALGHGADGSQYISGPERPAPLCAHQLPDLARHGL